MLLTHLWNSQIYFLIYNLILLWTKKTLLCVISTLFTVSNACLWPRVWSVLQNTVYLWEEYTFCWFWVVLNYCLLSLAFSLITSFSISSQASWLTTNYPSVWECLYFPFLKDSFAECKVLSCQVPPLPLALWIGCPIAFSVLINQLLLLVGFPCIWGHNWKWQPLEDRMRKCDLQ